MQSTIVVDLNVQRHEGREMHFVRVWYATSSVAA